MEIQQIRYFLEVCRQGTISKAANSLFVTQQGISSSIRKLEQELGCELFVRNRNALILTEDGQYFQLKASNIIREVDILHDHFIYRQSNNMIRLPIVYNLLINSPPEFQKLISNDLDTPEFSVQMVEGYSLEIDEMIENRQATYGMSYLLNRKRSNFNYEKLFSVQHGFIVNPNNPLFEKETVTVQDINHCQLIIPNQRTSIRNQIDQLFKENDCSYKLVLETNQYIQSYNIVKSHPNVLAHITKNAFEMLDDGELRYISLSDCCLETTAVCISLKNCKPSIFEQKFHDKLIEICSKYE